MKNVSFIKSPEEIMGFYNILSKSKETQEGIYFAWQTDIQILKKLIPSPLEPSGPYVMASVCYVTNPDFWKEYDEACLFIPVKYKNCEFAYFLSIQIAGDNDMPIFLGRESGGFPKKSAGELTLFRSGDHIKVSVERNGICFFEAEAEIGKFNHPDADLIFDNYRSGASAAGYNANFKYDLDCDGKGSGFTNVRLVASKAVNNFRSVEKARITRLRLTPSQDDPWSELRVLQLLGAVYYKSEVIMYPAETLVNLDAGEYAPYLFGRWDTATFGNTYRNFKISK
ncbi:MAG: acetoacetate decarboxylase family protein [Clostridiaceae bacterium]|jgi:acetoacetate decarboxylase|nr:acetoacetate decarboxylase family protein [Clostridiaceae bacterium]